MILVTKAEAIALTGHSENWIKRHRRAKRLRFYDEKQPSTGGSAQRFYWLEDLAILSGRDLSSLQIQLHALCRPSIPQIPSLSSVPPPAPPLMADHDPAAPLSPAPVIEPSAGAVEEATPFTELTGWQLEKANARLAIVQAVLDRSAAEPKRKTAIIREVAAAHGFSPSTVSNYLRAYREGDYRGLCPQWGRRPSTGADIKGLIEETYLDPKQPSKKVVQERIAAHCAEGRIPAPNYSTVRRICAKIPRSVVTFRREGRKAWALTYEPILRRDYADLAVGEMFCGDHRELDFFVKVGGKIQRPWLTAWMDLRTRLVVGWHLGLAPNSRTIALAFHHAVLACGRPAFVYIDNGKDYKSHALNGREVVHGRIQYDAETQGVFGGIGTGVIHALPYAARSKPIERWFRNLSDRFDREQPGWCGRNTMLRPEKLAREIKSGALLTLDEVPAKLAAFIAAYNAREHSELKCAPASLWEHATKEIPDARTLTLLLMKSKPTRVWNDGIHLHTMRYWASELSGVIGETVEVRYDPLDVSRLYVFHQRALLCEAATAITGSMKTGEAQILQKAKERKAARARVQRYPDDIRILHDPAEALRVAVGVRPAPPALPPPPPAVATRGDVVRLVLPTDGAARAVAALPAPVPVEAPATDPWLRAEVAEAVEACRQRLRLETEERQQQRLEDEAAAERYAQEQRRQLKLVRQAQGGGA